MKAKHVWVAGAAVLTAGAVGAVAAVGVGVNDAYGHLDHGTAPTVASPAPLMVPLTPGQSDPAGLAARLDAVAGEKSKDLATFGAKIVDTTTGETVWQRGADAPLTPASSTKLTTALAAAFALPETHRITTEVRRASDSDTVVLKAAGDVWLTSERLDELAQQIRSNSDSPVAQVLVDTSAWTGPEQAPGWDPTNVDEGFVAPIQPAMIYGGRLGATTGDVPRSHTPARDVADALAQRLDATGQVGQAEPALADAPVVATTETEPLSLRAQEMMKESDNVAAEAIAREVAAARGAQPSFAGASQEVLAVLREHGIDTAAVTINDNSGLSVDNRIPPRALTDIIAKAVSDEDARVLTGWLAVAGGEGTLYERYGEGDALAGRGWVRAKTGTLTGVSALAGTVPGESGHLYAFAFMVNGGDVTSARAAQDSLASALRDF